MAGQETERKGNTLPFRISGGNLGMSNFRGAIFIDGGYLDQVLIGYVSQYEEANWLTAERMRQVVLFLSKKGLTSL
jgi:hypothetical protein